MAKYPRASELEVAQALASSDPLILRLGLDILVHRRDLVPKFTERLIDIFLNGTKKQQRTALIVLTRDREIAQLAFPHMIRLVEDPFTDREIREDIVGKIKKCRVDPPRSIECLCNLLFYLLNDNEIGLNDRIRRALVRFGTTALNTLIELLKDGRSPTPVFDEPVFLQEPFQLNNQEFRMELAMMLTRAANDMYTPQKKRGFPFAGDVIAEFGDTAVPSLVNLIEQNNTAWTLRALQVLSYLRKNAEQAIPTLVQLGKLATNEIFDPPVISPARIPVGAFEVLCSIGPKALPPLRELEDTGNTVVKALARMAIEYVESNNNSSKGQIYD